MIDYVAITTEGRQIQVTLTDLTVIGSQPHRAATREIRHRLKEGERVCSFWLSTPWMEDHEYDKS